MFSLALHNIVINSLKYKIIVEFSYKQKCTNEQCIQMQKMDRQKTESIIIFKVVSKTSNKKLTEYIQLFVCFNTSWVESSNIVTSATD